MTDTTSAIARTRVRQWMHNWRLVNEAQDEIVRSQPTPDPEVCLEAGLSLIAFARRISESHPQLTEGHQGEADEDSVRRTWRRLRAAHVR